MTSSLPPELPNAAVKKTPGIAIASLILGIVSALGGVFFILPMVLAVVFGHLALSRIRRDPALEGSGLAITGLVLGYGSILIGLVMGGLIAAMAIPAFQKVRESSLEKAMLNDARQIASSAQQLMLEEGEKPVAFEITEEGTLSGPLSPYVAQVTKGTRAVDGVIENAQDGFSLMHPHVRRGAEVRFDADGRLLP